MDEARAARLALDDTRPALALRATDIDQHGHVNNAVYWQAVEHALASSEVDAGRPLVAELDFREPIDLDDNVELVVAADGKELLIGLRVSGEVRAAARVEGR